MTSATTTTTYTAETVAHLITQAGQFTLEELQAMDNPPWVERVVWTSGSSSWAKSWQTWDEKAQVWRLARVGAGAYGTSPVLWTSPHPCPVGGR
jgi:hypothetical protein